MIIYEYVNHEMLNADISFLNGKVHCSAHGLNLFIYWGSEAERESLEPELYFVEKLCVN